MDKKSATLNLRVDPIIKEALRMASIREHRSIANMIEVMILGHCEVEGIRIPEQEDLFEVDRPKNRVRRSRRLGRPRKYF